MESQADSERSEWRNMSANPAILYDSGDAIFYTEAGGTYYTAISALQKIWNTSELGVQSLLNAQYGAADFTAASQALKDAGVVIAKNEAGANCYAFASDTTLNLQNDLSAIINSNNTSTSTINAKPVINTTIDSQTGKVSADLLTKVTGGQSWKYFAVSGLQALGCASTGIWLGKTIDSALYNLNPDFWDSNGMSSLNPETWSSITNGDDSFASRLFNMVLGIDQNGNAQLAIDENALAYVAYYMSQMGVFAQPGSTANNTHSLNLGNVTAPFNFTFLSSGVYDWFLDSWDTGTGGMYYKLGINSTTQVAMLTGFGIYNNTARRHIPIVLLASKQPFTAVYQSFYNNPQGNITSSYTSASANTILGETVYFWAVTANSASYNNGSIVCGYPSVTLPNNNKSFTQPANVAYCMLFDSRTGGTIDGISNQSGATLPDDSTWTNPQNTLSSLKSQYPQAFADPIVNDVVQPDGTVNQVNYIPVPMPNSTGQYDSQPTTNDSTQTQSNTQVSVSPENADLLRLVLQLLTQPDANPESDTESSYDTPINPYNPVDTGSGDSPTPIAPTGSASALWSVYHPTQAQINSFGAWLWGSVFTTDIRKLFEDPIQGVIKLHKVFATPVDAGTGTIVVGTLDSNVSSATVTQQYVEIDCGSVDCHEDFGNVFDYPPYTEVSLYLPFIGIVPLDVNDVMRSTINVKYGVDVFTGACLAMVYVTRDANTVNMYQYAGVCSVDYPLSNVQASGMLAGLLATAGGIASVAVTGGMSLTAAGAVVGGALSGAKRTVGRSGGFSGNSGAMGIKKPYLIIQRPQTKVAQTFPHLEGYPTNHSIKLSSCSGHVVVSAVHVEGVIATKSELIEIEEMLKSGVLV